jgi:D-amino-acid dehydrogenase
MHLQQGEAPALHRAIHDIEAGFVLAPMKEGMRVTSGVELTDRDASPNYKQIYQAVAMARQAYDIKDQIDQTPWMGRRPTLIDSLPMIGAAPRHDGLWFNFGHQHLGLSLAPGSAQILATLIDNRTPPIDADAFSPARFRL